MKNKGIFLLPLDAPMICILSKDSEHLIKANYVEERVFIGITIAV
jgi:hypothetical protein